MSDVSVIIRCKYCESEIEVANGKLLKRPPKKEYAWWKGDNPPNPKNIRLTGICDAHETGNQ